MLALLLALAMQSQPVVPHTIESGALHLDPPTWSFIPLPSWRGPTRAVESLMFAVDIDPTAPVESEDRNDLDVYETEEP